MGAEMVPVVLSPRSILNSCRTSPWRPSLKLMVEAELTAAVVVMVRLPRLMLMGPVREALLPASVRLPGPVLVRPLEAMRGELTRNPSSL